MLSNQKSISINNKCLLSTNDQHSLAQPTYECGDLVWCMYHRRPHWPGIVSKKIDTPTGSLYNVLFFGTFKYISKINSKRLEPYDDLDKFQKRIRELNVSENFLENKPGQYDINITGQTLDLLRYAIKQASNSSKCSNPDDRLKSATDMLKRKRYNFLTFKLDDDKEKGNEDNDETTSNIIITTDQQFIQTINDRGGIKRELEDNENLSNTKKSRITTNDRPEQSSNNRQSSSGDQHLVSQPITMCSNFVYHSLTLTEENLILHAIERSNSDSTFFEAKQIAEEMYSNIICVNNLNRYLPVSEVWFYLFFFLHFEQLYSTHSHWLDDLEKATTNVDYLYEQQQKMIHLMKTYRR